MGYPGLNAAGIIRNVSPSCGVEDHLEPSSLVNIKKENSTSSNSTQPYTLQEPKYHYFVTLSVDASGTGTPTTHDLDMP